MKSLRFVLAMLLTISLVAGCDNSTQTPPNADSNANPNPTYVICTPIPVAMPHGAVTVQRPTRCKLKLFGNLDVVPRNKLNIAVSEGANAVLSSHLCGQMRERSTGP